MAMQTRANPADVTNRLQTYFSKKMLPHTKDELILGQFATPGEVPRNAGAMTMRWFKKRPAKTDDVQTLSSNEGVAISTYTEVDMGYVEATLAQYGEAAKISDILMTVDIFNILEQNIQTLGEDAALQAEKVTRNAIVSGMSASNNGFERFAGVTPSGTSAADFATLAGLQPANAKLTRARALGAVTQLRANKVPLLDGGYVCALPPEIMHDVRQDDDWLTAAKNSNPTMLYKRQAIELDGVRYVETTVPFIENATYGTYAAAGSIYTTMFLGRGAFGTPKMAGEGDPWAPKVTINNKPDKSDPLNQFAIVGWKNLWTAKLLKTSQTNDVPYCVLLRCKTTFA